MFKRFINWIRSCWASPKAEPTALVPTLNAPSWRFDAVWNQSLIREDYPLRPRNHAWASELGGAPIDTWLKMRATPYSNGPNDRSMRKFVAGDIWEWICALVLKRAGILIEQQRKLSYQYPGLLRVVGKQDFLAGGQPNWKRARREMEFYDLPKILRTASLRIVDNLEATYGNTPLRTMVMEIKSTSSFMFKLREKAKKASANHELQSFHYLKADNLPEAHVVYICRDDCLIEEFPIFNPSEIEANYISEIETITNYHLTNTRPPLAAEILFENFRFTKNWWIEYSNYLTLLYGYKEPIFYRDAVDKPIASMNRTFKRCVNGSKMTALNMEVIREARKVFPEWDIYVDQAKAAALDDPAILEGEEAA